MVSRKARDCSTVNTGSCSTVTQAMPSSSSRAKNLLRSAAIDAGVTSRGPANGSPVKGLILAVILLSAKPLSSSYGHRKGDQLQRQTVPSSANRMGLARARE
jgi:hypothetical protein